MSRSQTRDTGDIALKSQRLLSLLSITEMPIRVIMYVVDSSFLKVCVQLGKKRNTLATQVSEEKGVGHHPSRLVAVECWARAGLGLDHTGKKFESN